MIDEQLADVVMIVHLIYVSIVLAGVPLMLLGAARGWAWVRVLWLRVVHLLMIGIVALESILGIHCPLTAWEMNLRASPAMHDEGFIERLVHRLLFYHGPHWLFTLAYISFLLLVVSLFLFVPVQRKSYPLQ